MKKLLSILLAVLMVATLGVVNITAEGEEESSTPETVTLNNADVEVANENDLREAINTVKQTGGKIVLLNKIYLTDDVDFEEATVVPASNFQFLSEAGDDGKKMFIVSTDGVEISNVTIECNNVTNYGILFYNCAGGSVENVTIKVANWHAVSLNGAEISVNNLKALDAQGDPASAIEYAKGSGVTRVSSVSSASGITGNLFIDGPQFSEEELTSVKNNAANVLYYNPGTIGWCRVTENENTYETTFEPVALIDDVAYSNLQDAVNAAASTQDHVTLIANCYIDAPVVIANDVTIEMNGHSIAGNDTRAIHIQKGSVSIINNSEDKSFIQSFKAENGTLEQESSVIRVGNNGSVEQKEDANLYIGENVIVNTSDCYGITIFGSATNETLVVDGQISTVNIPAISGNGTSGYGGTNITINGSVYTRAENAIYHPQLGTLTINGSVFGKGGIEMKAGTVYFGENARVIASAETTSHTVNGNGCSTSGYALALVEHSSYSGSPTANINTGSFEGPVAIVVDNEVSDENKASLSVSGGRFIANIPSNVASGYAAFNVGKGEYVVATDPDKVSVLFDYSYVEKDFDLALGNFAWQNFTFTRNGKELDHHYVTYTVTKGDALKVNEYGYLDFTDKTGLVEVTATCGSQSASAYVYIVDSYETTDEGAASSDENTTSSTLNTESSKVIESIVANDSKTFEAKASLANGVTFEELKNDILGGKTVETILDSNKVDTVSNETTNAAVAAAEAQLGGGAKIAGSYDIQVKLIVDGKQKANITSLDNAIQLQIELPEEIRTVPSGYSREVAIVRMHNGVATVIAKGNVSELGSTITCSSNLFSEYVLVYRDTLDYVYTKPAAKKPVVNTSVR